MSEHRSPEQGEPALGVRSAKTHAAGVHGVAVAMHRALTQMGARPAAALCSVRGYSNVQGDRTMGIWEKPPPELLDALGNQFGFERPRGHGLDTVEAIRATLGRTEQDMQASGPQIVTVEDSTSAVHASRGPLAPASEHPRSEVAIVAETAAATMQGRHGIDWHGMRDDYDRIRAHISLVLPGFDGYNTRVREPGGFTLAHPVRDARAFPAPSSRAVLAPPHIDELDVPPRHLALQTLRSHDRFNTTTNGLSDRYRGVDGGELPPRAVRNPGRATIRRDACNPLVPLDCTAAGSKTPTSKSVVVTLQRSKQRDGDGGAVA